MANQKYDVCARLEIEGREKPVWPRIGVTITVRDDGRIGMFDARTGQNYFAFLREDKPEQAATTTPPVQQAAAPAAKPDAGDFDDDIPF